jgi:transcriptional regulator with XRE-family HTH domain
VLDEDARLEIARVQVGLRLRELRLQAGWTLAETAEYTGLTKGFVSDVERGRRQPSLANLLRYADVYGCLVTDLLDGVYPYGHKRPPRSR